ncbi:N-acetylneuraminate lyase isoform X2 [Nematostella vectensis]|uniref:N-acetylneuraminate lyase isoform X2 n=1 Tax=Nematostella vectensis TaxID=45351 RepID=UPI00207727DD|nr:N-acetylneuraminate lyase isoform X2 [Nematostella vectensis]
MSSNKITGLVAAPLAPFDQNGNLNTQILLSYTELLLANNVIGVYVNGTSGEGSLLCVEERKAIAQGWIEASHGRFQQIIIQVGTDNLKDTMTLATHAENIGATGIAVLPPVYNAPASPDAVATYLEQVSSAAPNTPLFYYHIPAWSGITFPLEDILEASSHRVPTLAGAKCTSSDLSDYCRCLRLHGGNNIDLLFDVQMLLGALAMGAQGFVGISFNYASSCLNRMIKSFNSGDVQTAREEQARVQDLFRVISKHGSDAFNIGVHKALMRLRGLELGQPRLPNTALTESQVAGLNRDLEEMGFLEWCK